MSGNGGKARKATAAPAAESSKRRRSAGATGTQGASQQTIDEAAEDAQAEQEMLNDSERSASDSRSLAAGAGAPKANVPVGLLERRLDKVRVEKGELEAKVAQLEAKLRDAEAPAPSPKVMQTICFSKFNVHKFVTLYLTDTKIGWSQFGKIQDSSSVAR